MRRSSGTIIYDPRTTEGGREHFDPWWVIVECDLSIWEAARARLESEQGIRLSRPLWGGHVSVVGGEEPPLKERWGERAGTIVEIEVSEAVETDGKLYWIGVTCEALFDLRERLGLSRAPKYPFHITLGRRRK